MYTFTVPVVEATLGGESPDHLMAPFWSGLADGELRVQRCSECDTWRWSPQLCCPRCLDESYEWCATSGTGTLYSYTRVHRTPDATRFPVPYVLVIVRLDEGLHVLSALIGDGVEQPRIDMKVRVRIMQDARGQWIFPFEAAP